jgi:hypothetical protein
LIKLTFYKTAGDTQKQLSQLQPRYARGALAKFMSAVSNASKGAVTD